MTDPTNPPGVRMVYATGRTEEEAQRNLILAHDPRAEEPRVAGWKAVGVRLYAEGKAYAFVDAPPEHDSPLSKALAKSLMCSAWIDLERFRAVLTSEGLDASLIASIESTLRLNDDAYLARPSFPDDPQVRIVVPGPKNPNPPDRAE